MPIFNYTAAPQDTDVQLDIIDWSSFAQTNYIGLCIPLETNPKISQKGIDSMIQFYVNYRDP